MSQSRGEGIPRERVRDSVRRILTRLDRALPVPVSSACKSAASRLPLGRWSLLPRTLHEERRALASGSEDGLAWLSARAGLPHPSTMVECLDLPHGEAVDRLRSQCEGASVEGVLAVARVAGLAAATDDDRRRALLLYEMALSHGGTGALRRGRLVPQTWRHAQIMVTLAIELRLVDRARELLDALDVGDRFRPAMEADLLNPTLNPLASRGEWLRRVNLAAGWCPGDEISLDVKAGSALFDGLLAPGSMGSIDGPLVSVVVPTYRPSLPVLLTSVRSLLRQTYGNVEIVVVDDASGPDWSDAFGELAALDSRIRVLHRRENGGAYVSRNTGMLEARGKFLAFQDADDWSHPRRLEVQIDPLLAPKGGLVATHSRSVRFSDELLLTYRSYLPLRHNASSLVMRRAEAISAVGYFAASRKGVDTEYAQRLANAMPGRVHGLPQSDQAESAPVLGAIRLSPNSLSRSDFRVGYRTPDRWALNDAFRLWHAQSVESQSWWVSHEAESPPFDVPRAYRVAPAATEHFDLVVVVDAQGTDRLERRAQRVLGDAARRGRRVGFIPVRLNGLGGAVKMSICDGLADLAGRAGVQRLGFHDDVSAAVVVIPNPRVFEFRPAPPFHLRAERVVVGDVSGAGDPVRLLVEQICGEAFQRSPEWLAEPLSECT